MAQCEQVYNILNAVAKQATGREDISVVDTSSFVAVANTVLHMGTDVFFNTLSDVLSRTIFSYRPNEKYTLVDGQSYNPRIVVKDKIAQFNFYDSVTHARYRSYAEEILSDSIKTIYENSLK